ncbi:gluconate 2-dehydrogenase gamma chain [Paraburkholderia sp. EB58]|jgi:gluconate 2-dehydrogenase gamma chain|uniref:gluconate 2-dehydrogenase subunit 3 family protein n=1 Tax=Paraburkholderia sp. EB58 TaxID=3035125 RepID=UPI003D1E51DD
MKTPEQNSRRSFLKRTIAIAPIAAISSSATALLPTDEDRALSAPPPNQPAEDNYQPGYFTPEEWAFVNAACDRLIPKDHVGPGAVELGAPQYIDRQMQTPYGDASRWYMEGPFVKAAPEFGYQSKLTPRQQYRLGIRAINAYCRANFDGKTFAELPPEQQTQFLKQMEAGAVKDEFNLKMFFSDFLLKNVMEGYFCDPMHGGNKDMAAWKMIGYPGVRADYLEWVVESKPYPYGPVSMYGKRG